MNFAALQVKTSYSILNSLNDIKKLVALSVNYGYTSLAITDEGNMFGVMEFYYECKKNNIKPIIGIELCYNELRFLLYAKNLDGYKNLIKLSTIVSSENLTMDILKEYRDNLILVMPFSFFHEDIYNLFDDKYLGYTNVVERDQINEAKVFINNVCYLNDGDDKYLDYAKMILTGKTLGEYEMNTCRGLHLLTKDEMLEICDKEDLLNIDRIVNECNVDLGYTKNLLPVYEEKLNSQEFLYNLAHKGLNKRLNGQVSSQYIERLNSELLTINKMGFNDYFLIVYDYVLYAKKNDILVGPGRGSAAGSLVSYSLGITDIDPLKYNLLFERFLNPERVTLPDIDIDFDANRRNEVIDYVMGKYGQKKVAGIITFNTLGAKQVVRDVGRILKINPRLIDVVARMCNNTLQESYKTNDNLKKMIDNSYELKKMFDVALHLEGLPRHISIHAAGIVMGNCDLDEVIPLYKNQLGMYVTGYSKDYLESLGLLKMDFLGISNLTMIDEIIQYIHKNEKLNIKFANIPEEDSQTIRMFARGDTDGIFQFESAGMKRFLKKLNPRNFNDIVSAISLYRPGPMESIDEYIARRNGRVSVDYLHPDLESILKETYGIIIYQEQIMQIAQVIAGYTLGEADILRRAMSKKKEVILIKEREKFVKQSVSRGYSEGVTNKVYDLILKFANYGFNKSHAVAYAMISYKMAFLKTHFYSYFMIALLNGAINNEEKTNSYIAMLRSKNVKVVPPDINLSTDIYQVINGQIVCPLTIIRQVGISVSRIILNERQNGNYVDFVDFVKRTYNFAINKKVLTSLIFSGVFKSFGYNKQTLINNLDNILNYADLSQDVGMIEIDRPMMEETSEYTNDDLIKQEFDCFGFYLTEHPVSKYKRLNNYSTRCLEEMVNQYLELVLEINQIKEIFTKNNDVMAFIKASDEYCQVELTLFPKVYKSNQNLKVYDIIRIYGRVDKRFDNYQIIVSNINKLN